VAGAGGWTATPHPNTYRTDSGRGGLYGIPSRVPLGLNKRRAGVHEALAFSNLSVFVAPGLTARSESRF
jgi:hypothetical protein